MTDEGLLLLFINLPLSSDVSASRFTLEEIERNLAISTTSMASLTSAPSLDSEHNRRMKAIFHLSPPSSSSTWVSYLHVL